jgi:hypothetical protein
MNKFRDVFVKKNVIQFFENGSTNVEIAFDNEKEAEQSFNYIIEGLKNKNLVIFI